MGTVGNDGCVLMCWRVCDEIIIVPSGDQEKDLGLQVKTPVVLQYYA